MSPYVEVLWKTPLSFLALWAVARLLGKKHIGQLTLFDFTTGITIGSITASTLQPGAPWGPMLTALGAWGLLAILFHRLDIAGRTLHEVLDDSPDILVQNGRVLEENLRRNQVTVDSLSGLLREKGYFSIDQVEFAVLETNGKLSVMPKSQYRPVQPRDLKVPTTYEGLPVMVVQEGRPLQRSLQALGLKETWLHQQLAAQGVASIEDVFAAWLSPSGRLVVDRYQDHPPGGQDLSNLSNHL